MGRIAVEDKGPGIIGPESTLVRLENILAEVWDEYPVDGPLDRGASLLSLGVDSLTLTILLDRLEGEFPVEWDPDDPPSAFSSLRSLAESLAESPAGSPAGSPTGSPAESGVPARTDCAGRK